MTKKAKLVGDLMTKDVATLERNDQLSIADQVMTLGRIRHMPVLDENGEIAGIISQRDLFRGALARSLGYGTHAQDRVMRTLLVKEVMTNDVITTTPNTPLADAAKTMVSSKVGCLPVVEDGRVIGILTESDFVRTFANTEES